MKINIFHTILGIITLAAVLGSTSPTAYGASPSADQALRLAPTQEGVDYDRPQADDVSRCKITARKMDGNAGWVVESPEGIILRKFVDTNGDNIVDQWSYYKDGVEVYRDIDSKFTGKADQFRWFHTAGTRWGIDTEGNGKVERWKILSAEEATAEVVAALVSRDADRFARVLLTPTNWARWGWAGRRRTRWRPRSTKAAADFRTLAARQRSIGPDGKWLQFTCTRPGTVPAGTDGSTKDLSVYENVAAIVESGTRHPQVQIGTLVRVGNVWKVIDAPAIVPEEGQAEMPAPSVFFQARPRPAIRPASAGSDKTQKLFAELEKVEIVRSAATAILEQLADQAGSPADRATWVRQLADTISAATQSGQSADGDKRLAALFEKLTKNDADKNLAAYVRMRQLMARYALSLQVKKADMGKIQTEWLASLEQYVADYPTSPDAAEAMLQLGIAREYAGQDDDAKKRYGRIVREFADSPQAKKAAGAIARLDSVGRSITLSGKSRMAAASIWPTTAARSSSSNTGPPGCARPRTIWPCSSNSRRSSGPSSWSWASVSTQRQGSRRIPDCQPVALAADLRAGWPGQPPGQSLGHHHRAHDDPGGSGWQGSQPQRCGGRDRGRAEEAAAVGD